MSFAVVDFETTGILPSYHHRVVEIGITHVEFDGRVSGHWETLINPERDLGPQRIHGVKASQVLQAPVFGDIAFDIAALLQGRVFVAHNASFDLRFVNAEFERAGYGIWGEIPHLCTMRLGAQFGLGGSPALSYACECFGIQTGLAHSAGSDSLATAHLLAAYLQSTAGTPGWQEYWSAHISAAQAFRYPHGTSMGVAWQTREESASEVHFLQRISTDAKHPRATGTEGAYFALLDRCLLDRVISVSEGMGLASVAEELGLSRFEVSDLHADYFRTLAIVAWADGILTEGEQRDLDAVADLLQIPADVCAPALEDARSKVSTSIGAQIERFQLFAGDLVVLTGEMSQPRSIWEDQLRARGIEPHGAITKKVRLLVAADPDTLSDKQKKARDYGIPTVTEDGLRNLLAEM